MNMTYLKLKKTVAHIILRHTGSKTELVKLIQNAIDEYNRKN